MKLVIDVLTDAEQLLSGLDEVSEMRPQTRETLRELVEQLDAQASRILRQIESLDDLDSPRKDQELGGPELSLESLVERGLSALADGAYDEAEACFEQAHRREPDEPVYLNHLGLIAWERGDFERAEARYERAMDAALAQSYGQIGGNELQMSQQDAYAQAMEGCALSMYQQQKCRQAAQLFDCLATMFPESYASCRYLEGEAWHAAGDVSAALSAYERAPVEPGLLYNRGLARWSTGRHVAAARDLLSAVKANPHIARRILEALGCDGSVPSTRETPGPDIQGDGQEGYLSSTHYAQDYLQACMSLWRRQDAQMPREILARCLSDEAARQFVNESQGVDSVEAGRGGRQNVAGGSKAGATPTDELARDLLADVTQGVRDEE